MKALQVLLLFVLSQSVFSAEPWKVDWSKVETRQKSPKLFSPQKSQPETERNGRIVGGWEVSPHSHPYQVGLLLRSEKSTSTFLCGGSILNNKTIITAAHCTESTDTAQIIVGAHNLHISEPSQQRFDVNSSNYRCHYGFNSITLNYDICIIFLNEEILFNEFVQPIELPRAAHLRERSFVAELATVT